MSLGKDLLQYVTNCDIKKVNKILQTIPGPDVLNYQNNTGNTPLIQACNMNSIDNSQKLTRALLDVRVDLEIANQNGDRALMLASKRGYNSVVDMLLAAGCNFDVKNELGQRPIDLAGNPATKAILQKLHDKKAAQERALIVENLSHRLLDMLLVPQNVQQKNTNSREQSFSLLPSTSIQVIDFLRQYSQYHEILEFESNEISHKRKRPLSAAIMAQDLPIVNFLLKSTPSARAEAVHSSCPNRYTPLMINCMIPLWPSYPNSPDSRLAEETRHAITRLLLQHVNSISQRDKNGITALMKAVEQNHQNDVEAIFEKYSSNFDSTLDAADKNGVTALIIAAKRRNYSMLMLLLTRHPDLNHRDKVDTFRFSSIISHLEWNDRTYVDLLEW